VSVVEAASSRLGGGSLHEAVGAGRVYVAIGERAATATTALAVALLPVLVPHGPANLAPVDVFIVLAAWTCLLWAGTARHLWRFPYALSMAVFMVGGSLGALAGPVPGEGLQALFQDMFLLAWCWVLANVCSSPRRLGTILTTWVYASIGWAVILFAAVAVGYAPLSGRIQTEGSRTALTLGDPSYSASYFFVSLMLVWATGRPRHRALRFLAYGFLVAAIVSAGSNSGLVSLVVGIVVAGILGIYERKGPVAATTALALVLAASIVAVTKVDVGAIREAAHGSRYGFIRDGIGRSSQSEAFRAALIQESVPLYRDGGPLGQGPVSTKTRLENEMAPVVKEAHDDYLAALLERGPLGFLGLILLIASVVTRALLPAVGRLKGDFGRVVVKPNALVGAVLGTFVASTVYELLHLRHAWALFAVVAAVYIWGSEPRADYET
jgi:hypothetical protein